MGGLDIRSITSRISTDGMIRATSIGVTRFVRRLPAITTATSIYISGKCYCCSHNCQKQRLSHTVFLFYGWWLNGITPKSLREKNSLEYIQVTHNVGMSCGQGSISHLHEKREEDRHSPLKPDVSYESAAADFAGPAPN